MREFDFDELDKAVSSLMNKNQKNTEDKPSDDPTANQTAPADEPTTATPSDDTSGSPATDISPVEPSEAKTEAEASPAADESLDSPVDDNSTDDTSDEKSENTPVSGNRSVPHRAGSFMDVKHDSSKMRTANPTTGRHGITIQPTGSSLSDKSDAAGKPEADDTQDEIAKTDETEALDMSASPFLSDAKVKKRPLGRPGSAFKANKSDDDQPEADKTDLSTTDTVEEPAPASTEEPVGLPEELQPDLVNIESDIDTTATNNDDAPAETDQKPKVDIAKELEPATDSTAESDPSDDAKPTGPVSIPQQYKESPSSQPQDSGTIYDTENYHQPIAHPAKKSSGWTIVIWIVLIIILGCALGAAAYFSGLI